MAALHLPVAYHHLESCSARPRSREDTLYKSSRLALSLDTRTHRDTLRRVSGTVCHATESRERRDRFGGDPSITLYEEMHAFGQASGNRCSYMFSVSIFKHRNVTVYYRNRKKAWLDAFNWGSLPGFFAGAEFAEEGLQDPEPLTFPKDPNNEYGFLDFPAQYNVELASLPILARGDVRKCCCIVAGGVYENLLFFPVIQMLKERYPGVEIDMVASPRGKQTYELNKNVKKAWVYDVYGNPDPSQNLEMIGKIKNDDYELLVSTKLSGFGHASTMWMTNARDKIAYVYPNVNAAGAGIFLTDWAEAPRLNLAEGGYHMYAELIEVLKNPQSLVPEMNVKPLEVGVSKRLRKFVQEKYEAEQLCKGEFLVFHGIESTSKATMQSLGDPDSLLPVKFWAEIAQAASIPWVIVVPMPYDIRSVVKTLGEEAKILSITTPGQDAPHMAENDDGPVVFEPDDVGQQIEAPEGHLQPQNNAENGAENDVQQPIVDDFIIPPDVDPLPDNVDHWVRRSTRPRRTVSRYDLSLHYIMLTVEGEPLTYKEAKTCEHSSKWELAMQEEIKALHANDTGDLVELPKGYAQTKGIDFQEVFSPVVKMTTLHALFAIVAVLDLELDRMDVHTAFLHGDVEEELYMKQPEGYVIPGKEHLVCKLNRSLYGLKQASRQWYKKFDAFMLKHGYKRSHADHCLYIKRDEDGSPIILVLYVDDILIAAEKRSTVDALKEQLKSSNWFQIREAINWIVWTAEHVLGVRIRRQRDRRILYLSQERYIEQVLDRFNMADAKPLGVPLQPYVKISKEDCPNSKEATNDMQSVPYASACGSLMYAMVATRPDITHAVGVVSRFMANPGRLHWDAVKSIMRSDRAALAENADPRDEKKRRVDDLMGLLWLKNADLRDEKNTNLMVLLGLKNADLMDEKNADLMVLLWLKNTDLMDEKTADLMVLLWLKNADLMDEKNADLMVLLWLKNAALRGSAVENAASLQFLHDGSAIPTL
ncbi:hypothetical protein L7F22_064484 [Adiantum nelumboides]|nr:hypothetical protein [Adiantum nelumboides]